MRQHFLYPYQDIRQYASSTTIVILELTDLIKDSTSNRSMYVPVGLPGLAININLVLLDTFFNIELISTPK